MADESGSMVESLSQGIFEPDDLIANIPIACYVYFLCSVTIEQFVRKYILQTCYNMGILKSYPSLALDHHINPRTFGPGCYAVSFK